MARAIFNQNQRVFVKPVGTWATIDKVIPHWVKGLDEPLRISYDLGLGRFFSGEELIAEKIDRQDNPDAFGLMKEWRLSRRKNRWTDAQSGSGHPYPGTHPVVVTDDKEWGGWRTPVAEYDRNPDRIEFQARLIVSTPQLLSLAKQLSRMGANSTVTQEQLTDLIEQATVILSHIYQTDDAVTGGSSGGQAQE